MPRPTSLLLIVLLLAAPPALAQGDGLRQIGDQVSEFLLRQQALGRLPGAHLSSQPLLPTKRSARSTRSRPRAPT